jgi:hypothetical protein
MRIRREKHLIAIKFSMNFITILIESLFFFLNPNNIIPLSLEFPDLIIDISKSSFCHVKKLKKLKCKSQILGALFKGTF